MQLVLPVVLKTSRLSIQFSPFYRKTVLKWVESQIPADIGDGGPFLTERCMLPWLNQSLTSFVCSTVSSLGKWSVDIDVDKRPFW